MARKITDRRRRLAALVITPIALRAAISLMLIDAPLAAAFAAGLAGAIAHVTAGASAIVPWLALMIAAALLRSAIAYSAARLAQHAADAATTALRREVVGRVLDRMPGSRVSTGAAITSAIDEAEAIHGYVAGYLPARAAAAGAPFLIAILVALASPIAAALLVATLIPFILALALAGGAAADESRRQMDALSRLSAIFADQIRALPIILAFRGEAREEAWLTRAAGQVADRTMRVLRIAFLSSGALEFFSAVSVALVAVYAGFNLLGLLPIHVPERLDLFRAFYVLALAPEFYLPMRKLAAAYHERQAAESAIDRLDALPAAVALRRAPKGNGVPDLIFEDVTITYRDADQPAVRNFTLHVTPGEVIALVGPSGSGKSSLLHVLLGLAPLSGGRVLIDGEPCGDVSAISAWAGQQPLVIAGTIAENIALAAPDAGVGAVEHCAARAGLVAMLERRPSGLATELDARGGGLSGGERRRLGLARAILKNAPLLLLDEPTAHLDASAEAEVIDTIRTTCRGRTTIIATHSPRLAAIADRIVTLGDVQ